MAKKIEKYQYFLVPEDNKSFTSAQYLQGGLHTFSSLTEYQNTLEKGSFKGEQIVGMIIFINDENGGKYYKLSAQSPLAIAPSKATIEELNFGGATAYTYDKSETVEGGVITSSTVTVESGTTQIIQDLLTRISYLEEKLKMVDNKATLYDANSGDDAKITIVEPYSVNTDESMSGHTGILIENEHFNSGIIDDTNHTNNSLDGGLL